MWDERERARIWAARWHYPQLYLSRSERIYAGEQAWKHFLAEATDETFAHLQRQILRWNARAAEQAPALPGEKRM